MVIYLCIVVFFLRVTKFNIPLLCSNALKTIAMLRIIDINAIHSQCRQRASKWRQK